MVPDLAGLLRALVEARVRFVVIGGIAVAAHAVIRATDDLDIVPEPSAANLDDVANLLVSLDARVLSDPRRAIDAEVRAALHRGRNLTVTTSLGDLDVVQRLPGVRGYAELEAEGWEAELLGARFRVCSRRHLFPTRRNSLERERTESTSEHLRAADLPGNLAFPSRRSRVRPPSSACTKPRCSGVLRAEGIGSQGMADRLAGAQPVALWTCWVIKHAPRGVVDLRSGDFATPDRRFVDGKFYGRAPGGPWTEALDWHMQLVHSPSRVLAILKGAVKLWRSASTRRYARRAIPHCASSGGRAWATRGWSAMRCRRLRPTPTFRARGTARP